jgi:hypothetical protein
VGGGRRLVTSWRRRAAREFSQRAKATMSATPAATPMASPIQNPIPLPPLLRLNHPRPLRLPLRKRPARIWGPGPCCGKRSNRGGVGGRAGRPGQRERRRGTGSGRSGPSGAAAAAGRDEEFEKGKKKWGRCGDRGAEIVMKGESETGSVRRSSHLPGRKLFFIFFLAFSPGVSARVTA